MMFQGEDFFNSTVGLQAGEAGRLPRDRHFPVYISLLKLRTVISRNTKSHCNVLMSAFFFFFFLLLGGGFGKIQCSRLGLRP